MSALTMSPDALPTRVAFARASLERYHALCDAAGRSAMAVALKYARESAGEYPLVLGAVRAEQLRETLDLLDATPPLPDALVLELRALAASADARLRDPRQWSSDL